MKRQQEDDHAAGAIRRNARDPIQRAHLLTLLGIFGKLAYPEFDPVTVIGSQDMKESPFYQQIMDEGGVLVARRNILTFLAGRFGKRAANSVELAINGLEDLARLEQLVVAASRCRSIDQFREELEGPRPSPRSRRRPSSRQ